MYPIVTWQREFHFVPGNNLLKQGIFFILYSLLSTPSRVERLQPESPQGFFYSLGHQEGGLYITSTCLASKAVLGVTEGQHRIPNYSRCSSSNMGGAKGLEWSCKVVMGDRETIPPAQNIAMVSRMEPWFPEPEFALYIETEYSRFMPEN